MQDEKQIRAHSLSAYNTVIYPTKYHYITQIRTIHKIKKAASKNQRQNLPGTRLVF